MRVVVCLKHVPDTSEPKKFNPATSTLVREGVQSAINPMDEYALEIALLAKDEADLEVVLLCLGPESARDTIKKGLAKGADRAVLVTDPACAGSDVLGTSRALAAAIKKIGDVDLVLCGIRSSDGDTYQVGPALAERLGLPQLTFGRAAKINQGEKWIQVEREVEGGIEVTRAQLPALATIGKCSFEPRLPSFKGIMAANKKELLVWSAADLALSADQVGAPGSSTTVVKVAEPEARPASKMLTGSPAEVARQLVSDLKAHKFI